MIGDVRRANVAIAFAWTPQRAAVLEALVRQRLSGRVVRRPGRQARSVVATSRTKAMDARRTELRKDDPDKDVPEVPVFLLGSTEGGEHLTPVELVSEFELFGGRGPAPRVPNAPDAEASALSAAVERLAARAKLAQTDDAFTPEYVARNVVGECAELQEDEVLEDVWARDHTIWKDDPTRDRRPARLARRRRTDARRGEGHRVVRGTDAQGRRGEARRPARYGWQQLGGRDVREDAVGRDCPLTVLDTTHPDHIAAVTSSLDLEHTIFVVGSKSGTTIETRAHLEYFWSLTVGTAGERFVAITDPGSELAALATERGFARVFENPPDIGGRYSPLSYFGLVPAALAGVDVEPVIDGARRAMVANGPGVGASDAPAARLAAAISECARKDGRDKLTLVPSGAIAPLGPWVEQLIAESTGKDGKGILPVVGEPLGAPDVYGPDRLFVLYTVAATSCRRRRSRRSRTIPSSASA